MQRNPSSCSTVSQGPQAGGAGGRSGRPRPELGKFPRESKGHSRVISMRKQVTAQGFTLGAVTGQTPQHNRAFPVGTTQPEAW